jgi:hypothetical protein
MKEGTFSVTLHLRDIPKVVVGIDEDAVWLDLDTFTHDNLGVSNATIHFPSDPAGLRKLAADLNYAAALIARTAAKEAA